MSVSLMRLRSRVHERRFCCICICAIKATAEVKTLACGHAFHPPCIDEWTARSPTCPYCRRDL
jgi:hypothetical protein